MPHTDHRHKDHDVFELSYPRPMARRFNPARWLGVWMMVLSLCRPAPVYADADEAARRQHDAHVHDVAHLSLISEGAHLRLELRGAAAGFLGFEHAPKSEDEIHAIAALRDQLQAVDGLFRIDAEARCSMDAIAIAMPGLEHRAGNPDHDDHHHQTSDDDHHHQTSDDDHHHQASHDESHGAGHADIEAHYDFTCRSVDALETVTVTLFDHFPGFETVEAVYLLDDRQSAQTLRPGRSVLRLR